MPDKRKYQDRAEYLKQAVSKRRTQLKQRAIEYKGGSCVYCNYNKCASALEFHHTDPSQKDFGISKSGITRSWSTVQDELDKCILVCSNCHKEIHAGLLQPSMETLK